MSGAEGGAVVSLREWRWAWAYALLLVAVTLIPYLIGWASAGDEWLYNGFVFGVEDGNAYLGKMGLGYREHWHFYLFYTPQATESVFGLYLPHILIGHGVRALIGPDAEGATVVTALAVAFQVWRMAASLALVLATYRFIAAFIVAPRLRRLALLVATLGGGLGWLLVLAGQANWLGTLPLDFFVPESFSFLVLHGLPHIATARAALLLGFVVIFGALRADDQSVMRQIILAALLWNLVGLMVTFYLAVLYVILAAWGLGLWWRARRLPWRYVWRAGAAAGLTLPLFGYFALVFLSNDTFGEWSAQNYLPSPHLAHYIVGYGLLALPALWGGVWAWRRGAQDARYMLLLGWVLAVPVMVYLPLNVQRRLAEAVLVPLAILAVVGLNLATTYALPGRSARRRYRWARAGWLVLLLPSAGLLWLSTALGMLTPVCNPDLCIHRPMAEVRALDWLQDDAPPDSVVLGAFNTGNYLPSQTDLRPFVGHGPETVGSEAKQATVTRFYRGEMSPGERAALFARDDVRYILYGPLERAIAEDASLWNDGLVRRYAQAGYVIYEVPRE